MRLRAVPMKPISTERMARALAVLVVAAIVWTVLMPVIAGWHK